MRRGCRARADLAKAYEIRGSAHKALGNLQAALQDFDKVIALAPALVMPYNYRAGVHYARGQYAAAVRDHMEALKRDPRHAGTFNQLAWVWSTCPDPDVRNGERAHEMRHPRLRADRVGRVRLPRHAGGRVRGVRRIR